MAEISRRKEDVVSSLANAEHAIQRMRDHLMSAAFRTIEAPAKEELLVEAQAAAALLQPGVDKLEQIMDAIES